MKAVGFLELFLAVLFLVASLSVADDPTKIQMHGEGSLRRRHVEARHLKNKAAKNTKQAPTTVGSGGSPCIVSKGAKGTKKNNGGTCQQPSPSPALATLDYPNDGFISMVGFSPTGFNPTLGPLRFVLTGAKFGEISKLVLNGSPIDLLLTNIVDNGTALLVNATLIDGKNDIYLKAMDDVGRTTFFQEALWAGSHNTTVNVLNGVTHLAMNSNVTVTVFLAEDPDVMVMGSSVSGKISFGNVPDRTIVVKGTGSDGSFGSIGGVPSDTMTLYMNSLSPPSSVANLDFSAGLTGWKIESDANAASIVPHDEGTSTNSNGIIVRRRTSTDYDLILQTMGEGEQYMHHQFVPSAGVSAVKVRYRFQTDEVPRWFGTEFNDYFSVSIKSIQNGIVVQQASESNCMNGLGLSQFLPGGYTAWREIQIPVDVGTASIQVDLIVANVGDGVVDSSVIVDYIEETGTTSDNIQPTISWDGIDGGLSLQYQVLVGQAASGSKVSLFWANGNTPIGDAFFTLSIPAGAPPNLYGPQNVPVNALGPEDVTGIVALSGNRHYFLPDVEILKGTNADFTTVTPIMFRIIKGGLRAAGQPQAYISSTTRTPEDQARAMFDNLVKDSQAIAQNIQDQLNIYAAPGDAVIKVFQQMTSGMTREQIIANRLTIQNAMTNEINIQGPSNVSKHCADPALFCVVDVGGALLPAAKGQRFLAFTSGTITHYVGGSFLDERSTNNCFHFVLQTMASAAYPTTPSTCITSDGRAGTCINTNDCGNGMESVPYNQEPKPNCFSFPKNVQCCVAQKVGETVPPKPGCPATTGPDFTAYLKLAEGYVGLYPYKSLEGGNPTVGYGHKLTNAEVTSGTFAAGLTMEEAEQLLLKDVQARIGPATSVYESAHGAGAYAAAPVWGQRILIDKVFQVGEGGLASFVKMMNAISIKDKNGAYKEMLTGYTDTNGNWVWDYGRRDKFMNLAMVNC